MSSTTAAALTVSDPHDTVRSQMAGLLAGLVFRAVGIGVGAAVLIVSCTLALF